MSYFMFVRYVYVRSLVLYTAACFATCGVHMSYFMFVRYVYVRSLVLYTAACFATCGVYVVLYVCSVCVCTIIGAVHSCLLCYMWSICRTLCLFGMCMYDHWCCTQLLALLHVEYMSYFMFVRYVYVRSLVLYTAACFATCGVYVVLSPRSLQNDTSASPGHWQRGRICMECFTCKYSC